MKNDQTKQLSSSTFDVSEQETHRVLCVDDEPAVCFAYSKLLASEPFSIDVCESIEAARGLLKKNDYFAVISDVRFAGSDNEEGLHFVNVVRKEQPKAKVILVTGYGNDELKKAVHEIGDSHYFEKPVQPSVIIELLSDLHDKIHEQNSAEPGKPLADLVKTDS